MPPKNPGQRGSSATGGSEGSTSAAAGSSSSGASPALSEGWQVVDRLEEIQGRLGGLDINPEAVEAELRQDEEHIPNNNRELKRLKQTIGQTEMRAIGILHREINSKLRFISGVPEVPKPPWDVWKGPHMQIYNHILDLLLEISESKKEDSKRVEEYEQYKAYLEMTQRVDVLASAEAALQQKDLTEDEEKVSKATADRQLKIALEAERKANELVPVVEEYIRTGQVADEDVTRLTATELL